MTKQHPCKLSDTKLCKHGGNKRYGYGYWSGTAGYCYKVKRWLYDLKECPLRQETTADD